MTLASVLAIVLAYLIGSLSFAVLVSKAMGLNDPRSYGSGNPGATNVLRSGNRQAAVLTLLLDAFKGWLPVFMVSRFGAEWGLDGTDVALVGLAAFLGHLYPVFFGFKGGKGVATAAGVLLAFEPMLGLGLLAIWGLVALVFRYSSLAALVTALASPMLYMAGSNGWWPVQGPILLAIIAMSLLLIWRHRSNISKLFAGTEGKLGSKKK